MTGYTFYQRLERKQDTMEYLDGQNVNMYVLSKNTKRIEHTNENDKKSMQKYKQTVYNPVVINKHIN